MIPPKNLPLKNLRKENKRNKEKNKNKENNKNKERTITKEKIKKRNKSKVNKAKRVKKAKNPNNPKERKRRPNSKLHVRRRRILLSGIRRLLLKESLLSIMIYLDVIF